MDFLTLSGLLALGTVGFYGFWAAFVAVLFVLVFLTESEHWGAIALVVIAAMTTLAYYGLFNAYYYALAHPIDLLWTLGVYVFVGTVWGTIKWWRFVRSRYNEYESVRAQFFLDNKVTEFTDELRVKWTEFLANSSRYSTMSGQAPLAANHKGKIVGWMMAWPLSMLGTLCSDILRRFFSFIYDLMGGVYTTIANMVYKGAEGDVLSKEQIAEIKETARLRRSRENSELLRGERDTLTKFSV